MAGKNPLRRLFTPVQRAPIDAVEVQDSTWDEWESVVNALEESDAPAGPAKPVADPSVRTSDVIPSRRR